MNDDNNELAEDFVQAWDTVMNDTANFVDNISDEDLDTILAMFDK